MWNARTSGSVNPDGICNRGSHRSNDRDGLGKQYLDEAMNLILVGIGCFAIGASMAVWVWVLTEHLARQKNRKGDASDNL